MPHLFRFKIIFTSMTTFLKLSLTFRTSDQPYLRIYVLSQLRCKFCCFHFLHHLIILIMFVYGRSQWPRGLRRRSSAARLLRLWVRFPPGAGLSVCCECCVFSGKGLCDELITRPEGSYRLCCVVCDLETTKIT